MIILKGEQVDTRPTFLIHVLSSLRLANKLRLSSVQNNWGRKNSCHLNTAQSRPSKRTNFSTASLKTIIMIAFCV